jgi:hypothetical protein
MDLAACCATTTCVLPLGESAPAQELTETEQRYLEGISPGGCDFYYLAGTLANYMLAALVLKCKGACYLLQTMTILRCLCCSSKGMSDASAVPPWWPET